MNGGARSRESCMVSKVGTLAAALAALALAGAGTARAAEEGPYPIWWSPALELESLDDIDARLDRELWPGKNGLTVYKWGGEEPVPAVMNSCATAIRLTDSRYQAPYYNELKLQWHIAAKCRAIQILKHAKPAIKSYVRELTLDRNIVNYLPGLVAPGPSCSGICWRHAANDMHLAWSTLENFSSITEIKENEIVIETETYSSRIRMLARADFNADGLEDIVLLNSQYATQGTGGRTSMFVLTRGTAEEVLRVLDSDRYLCPTYECRGPYEFPSPSR